MTKWRNFKNLKFWAWQMTWPNDYWFRLRLKEKRYYFCKDFVYGHDLHINKMWKRLFWKPDSEDLKIKFFERGRSMDQNNHYFWSYMTQKTLIILYELPLWILKWLSLYKNSQILWIQILRVADCCFINIIIFCHTSKNHLGKIHKMYFINFKEIFVTVLTLVANYLSWRFDKVKTIKFKG